MSGGLRWLAVILLACLLAPGTALAEPSARRGALDAACQQAAAAPEALTAAATEHLHAVLHAHAIELAAVSLVVIVLLVVLIAHAFRSNRNSKKQLRRYMLLSDVSEEYIYEYDAARDVLTLAARCSELLGVPASIAGYRKHPERAIVMSDGQDILSGESRVVAVGQAGTFRVVNSVVCDRRGRAEYHIGKLVDISEETERLHKLAVKADMDGLTGVYNAAAAHALIKNRYEAQRVTASALFVIDLDNFKQINDTYGHYVGDSVLTDLAHALHETFRGGDIIGRVGGDEFCVHMTGNATETMVARKFRALRAQMQVLAEAKHYPAVTLSAGVLVCVGHELTFVEAYQRADAALYEAKQNGRDGCRIIRYAPEPEQGTAGEPPADGDAPQAPTQEEPKPAALRRILIVDDNAMNRRVLCGILDSDYETLTAANGQEALETLELEGAGISAVILDLLMPVMDGYELLERMRSRASLSRIPVIVATGSADEGTEVKSLYLGANDFIAKPYNAAVIRRRLKNTIELSETAAFINAVERDELTGLLSKEFFYKKAQASIAEAPVDSYDLICCDIERFQLINELFGRKTGDALLRYVAGLIRKNTPDAVLCGRVGTDRFACLVPHRDRYDSEIFAAAVSQMNEFPISLEIRAVHGIYPVTDPSVPVSTMCDRALTAADSVKGKYGVYAAYYDDLFHQKRVSEQKILDGMRAGLMEQQFVVYYQPKYNLATGRVTGAEALVRWRHPEAGMLAPGAFIPLFEQNGFITDLDAYVWETACRDLRDWIAAGNEEIPVSVNVSRADIFNPAMTEMLLGLVDKYRLKPELLHLEITETAYMEDPEQLVAVVAQLKAHGFLIEMDDFGAGYSSLNMLSELPINILKLDMHFIREMADERKRSILNVVLFMADRLGLPVVAEGVETAEQAEILRGLGCEYAQGFYFAKPQAKEEFERHLHKALAADAT